MLDQTKTVQQAAGELEDSPLDDAAGLLVKHICRMTGLEYNEAKTVFLWVTATHGLSRLDKFPILAIQGPAGTGKTTILSILKLLAHAPKWIDGKETKAVLRDSFPYEGTALIDEADEVHEPWLVNRYAKQSGTHTVKRGSSKKGWEQETMNLFGATALHRRLPFRDSAILSRSIVLSTKPRLSVSPFRAEEFAELSDYPKTLAESVDWGNVNERGGRRIKDTWAPVMEVAEALEDTEWLEWAESQMADAEKSLHAGQEEEPTAAVFLALLAEALGEFGGEPATKVALGQVTERLTKGGHNLNSWQVSAVLHSLDFEVIKRGGTMYVYTGGTEKLVEVGRRLGIQDEWIEEHDPGK